MPASLQDNEISREQRRRQRTDKELRDVRSKLDIKTAEHEEVKKYLGSVSMGIDYCLAATCSQREDYNDGCYRNKMADGPRGLWQKRNGGGRGA